MIVIADLHIGRTNDSVVIDGVPSQTRDILKRLTAVTARAKMTKQIVVVAGDIFNTVNPSTRSIDVLFSWLRDCRNADVTVCLLAGNHDAGVDWVSSTMLNSASLPNVHVARGLEEVPFIEDHFTRSVVLFPHIPASEADRALAGHPSISSWAAARFPHAELVIGHGMVSESDYVNDVFFEAGNAMVINPSAFKGLKLMVLGHVHDHTKGAKWVYPGSLTINNFGEVNERKGWVEIDLSTLEYSWHEFPDDVTPWVHVEIDLTDKDERSLDEDVIRELVDGAIVKVTVLARNHGVVDEAYLRGLIGRWGHVSRFETKVVGEKVVAEIERKRVSHEVLLEQFVDADSSPDAVKAAAKRMGFSIISKVRESGRLG